MRAPWIALLAVLCLLAVPAKLAADEPPAKPPAPEEAKPDEKPADEKGGEAEAEKPLTPTQAWSAMQAELRELPYAQRRARQAACARAFVEEWKARGETAAGQDLYHLGMFHRLLVQYAEAVSAFRSVSTDAEVPATIRDLAAVAEAGLLTNSKVRAETDAAELDASRERLLEYAAGMTEAHRKGARTSLRVSLAYMLDAADQEDASLEMLLRAVLDDPMAVSRTYRSIVRNLLSRGHDMDAYPAMRASAIAAMSLLRHRQQQAVDEAKERVAALKAEGNESGAAAAERSVAGAERMKERIASADRPFEMLGQPAPAWTLDKAFGDVQQIADLEGKVVMLDFWATWCGWCVRSFPAIRDLLRDYGDRGLVVVGVTASSGNVYEHRYDLDEDFKEKVEATEGGYRPKLGARLAAAGAPADGETVFEEAAFRAKEKEVIARFIANHEMTWPVVMIDKAEPAPKYALTGWPHAVVLDRQGRVRYFKSGALLRDRPENVKAFRKVLEDLLAEPATDVAR